MAELKTRNVFLDTQVFFDSGFNYKRPPLSTVSSHAAKGDVRVFLTDVTVEEVKANVREAVEVSVQKHQSFLNKVKDPAQFLFCRRKSDPHEARQLSTR